MLLTQCLSPLVLLELLFLNLQYVHDIIAEIVFAVIIVFGLRIYIFQPCLNGPLDRL